MLDEQDSNQDFNEERISAILERYMRSEREISIFVAQRNRFKGALERSSEALEKAKAEIDRLTIEVETRDAVIAELRSGSAVAAEIAVAHVPVGEVTEPAGEPVQDEDQ